jgi:hypothetical protein
MTCIRYLSLPEGYFEAAAEVARQVRECHKRAAAIRLTIERHSFAQQKLWGDGGCTYM